MDMIPDIGVIAPLKRMANRRWLAVILLVVAMAVQAAFVIETSRQAVFALPLIDSAAYHQQAQAILVDNVPREPFWQPPLYPYWLALVYTVVGTGMTAVRLIHGLLFGGAIALLTFAIARRLMGIVPACIAVLSVMCYGPLVWYLNQLLPVGLAIALDLAAIIFILRAIEHPSAGRWLAAGAAIGAAALAVPNALVLLPVAVGAVWYAARRAGSVRPAFFRNAGLIMLGALVAIAPVTIRNRVVGGAWVPIATNGGINFYIGNNPRIDVTIATRPGIDWDRMELLPHLRGVVPPAAADRFFWNEARRYITDAPGAWFRDLARKVRWLIHAREMPRNLDIYTVREGSWILQALVWRGDWFAVPFGLLAPLALVGFVMYGWRRIEWAVIASFILLYAGSIVCFFPAGRYRAPLIPALAICAVAGVAWLWRERGRTIAWSAGLGLLIAGGLAANWPVAMPTDRVSYDADMRNAIGAGVEVRGNRTEALQLYDAAIRADPSFADAHYNRANALTNLRRVPEAIESYRTAIRLRPDHDKARVNLGILLYKQNKIGAALNEFQMAVTMNPVNPKAHMNLGVVLYGNGNYDEALEHFRAAAAINPEYLVQVRQIEAQTAAGATGGSSSDAAAPGPRRNSVKPATEQDNVKEHEK